MRFLIVFASVAVLPEAVFAHVGHLGGLAGHDHWIAGIAIGVAVGLGVREMLKGRKKGSQESTKAGSRNEPQADDALQEV